MRFSGAKSSCRHGLRQCEAVLDGVRISYTEAGDGPPVLMLHGAVSAGNVFWWDLQVALSAHARTIAPDFPGWGESDRPLTAYTREFYHRFLDDFLAALGLDRVTIVAHSMGGLIGSSYALMNPHRVAGLSTIGVPPVWVDVPMPNLFQPFLLPVLGEAMLLATPFLGTEHPWGIRRYYEALFQDLQQVGDDRLREVLSQGCEVVADAYHRQAFLSTMRANQTYFTTGASDLYRERLKDATFPVMMVAGAQDPLFPIELFHVAAERHPDARLVALDPCGHFPMWECPERVTELLKAFVAPSPVIAEPARHGLLASPRLGTF
jgi:haloalkane dehalogenase